MVYYFAFGILSFSLAFDLAGVIVLSSKTPSSLIYAFQTLQTNNTSFTLLDYTSQTMDFLSNSLPNFIVDASSSSIVSHNLDTFSSLFSVLLLKIGKPEENKTRNEWKFFSSPSLEYETQAFKSLISFFEWDTFHLFSSEKPSSLSSIKNFKNRNGQQIIDGYENIVTELMDIQVMIDYIGRLIKPSGNWKLLIFNEQESSSKILEAIQKMKMMKKGCGVILKFSGLSSIPKQIILIAEEGTEVSTNYQEFQVKELELMISLIERVYQEECFRKTISNDCLREELKEVTENGGRIPTYLILNSKEKDILTPIGNIKKSQVTLQGNLTLPGGQIQFTNEKLKLLYSQNSGYINHLGEVHLGSYIFFGAIQIYLDIINEDESQLENFQLVATDVDCGSRYFYYDYFKECFQNFRDSLGLFYLHSAGQVTYETVQLWREMDINIFQIFYLSTVKELYDKQLYPQLVISSALRQLQYNFLPTFLSYHRWKNIVALEANRYYLEGSSKAFYQSCQNNGITVHNSQQTRVIPDQFKTDQNFEDYKHYFQEYYDSGIRVFVLLQTWNEYLYIIESLYKIGFRKGDIQIFSVYDPRIIFTTFGRNFQQEVLMNIKSLLTGSLWIYQAEYVNDFQYTLKPIVQQVLYPYTVDGSCFAMDMLQLGAFGVDTLLTTGRDYQDPVLINESVRMQRFKGCSGTFSIDSSSNQRRDVLYFLGYIKIDLTSGDIFGFISGWYSAVQNPWMIIEEEFQYSNESTLPPSDMRFKSWDCDFPIEIVQENSKSMNLQAFVLSSVVGGSLAMASFLVFVFRKKHAFEISNEKNIMGLDDIFIILSIAIENIQYLQIGPVFSEYNSFIDYIKKYSSIIVINMYDWRKKSFWIYIYVCYGITTVWVLLIFAYFLTLLIKTSNQIRRFFFHIGQNVMPGLTNIFLVPLLISLFQILQCNDGISEELEDSYMNRDCDTFCWKDTHFKHYIGSLCLLFTLNISTVFYKYIHSLYSTNRNLQILPFYSYIRVFLQISLSVLSLTLRNRFTMIFNITFSLFMIGNLIVSYKLLIYNYKRIQLVQVFAVSGVVWSVFLKQGSRYELIQLFKFMFGKQNLKTITIASNKYRVNPREEGTGSTVVQSKNFQTATIDLNR